VALAVWMLPQTTLELPLMLKSWPLPVTWMVSPWRVLWVPASWSGASWPGTYLGTDSPIGAVADTARSLQPAVVVLLSMTPDNFLDHAQQIADLANQVPVLIAGPDATPQVARLTQARVLDQDPVSAAGTVDRGPHGPR
jgi:hypothetical protein